jgi:hypothetical protein
MFRPKKPLPADNEKTLRSRDSAIQIQDVRLSIASSIDPDKCSVCEGTRTFNLHPCVACDGTGLPSSNSTAKKLLQQPKKWATTIKSWFTKSSPQIVVVRGMSSDIEAPRPVLTRSAHLPRPSLDPGAQSEWAKAIRPQFRAQPVRFREEQNCKSTKMRALIHDIEHSSEIDFTDIVCRHAYVDVD